MRLNDDYRKCVVFIGVPDDTPGLEGINCFGTAFLVYYGDYGYLVTARHVAAGFGDDPFVMRFNRTDGTADTFSFDLMDGHARWHVHTDDDVDLAVMPLYTNFAAKGIESLYIPESLIFCGSDSQDDVGIGDTCYTIGLFRLMAGKQRNLPIVHTGNIAALPKDEKIPVKGWLNGKNTQYVEGYIIETQALSGLSGAPVFVRPVAGWIGVPLAKGKMVTAHLPKSEALLLGVWQSSWDAPPGEVLSTGKSRDVRVPVGMGVVSPMYKLIEIFDLPALVEQRNAYRERQQMRGTANLDKS